ncbi:ABC transporter substrate-binding protein [Pseudonocardia kunmingensis]|uniref:Peptide/nickel transport system substrate-binding protein n=1 Tax=Pseudonocardia kunmingensis TaxID=630975 RepID=A0A543CY20_9PSEU|nr:ABC transporter substrate-binding protein [Pseudonocardia kunmingensis]TQM01758.1 peptide/nickel transport system substrate-binding protein [Pseudonocardia kunmingensis]
MPPALPTRRRPRRRNRLLAGLLAVASAAACSSGGADPSGTAGGAPDPAGTVNVVHGSTPNQFDPCGTLNGSELAYMWAVYAPLIRSNPVTGELTPGIATAWETAPDGLSLTLTLRSGLTFQDGTPLDATTAAQSLEQCIALGNQTVPGLEGVTAPDPQTLVFTLSSPSSGLVDLLGSRLGLLASPRAREAEGTAFGSKPVGAGPYQLTEFVPGSSIRLTRWDGYQEAGPPPGKVAAIAVQIITDPSAQVAALTGGQADYGYRLESSAAAALRDVPGVTLSNEIGVAISDLNVDRSQGPLQDVRVRQAISYAIDRTAVAAAANDGLSDVGSVQPYPPGHPYHFDDLNGAYPRDLAKARQLLAEAGYPDGVTLRGVSLDGANFQNNAVLIAQQLAEAGITVNFEAKALPDATKSFYTDHQYDIFSTGMNSGPDWLTIYRRLLATTSSGNAGKVSVPGGDEALAQLNAATTPDQLEAALRNATQVLQDQLPIVPLYFTPYVAAWTDRVAGGPDAFAINGEADFTALGVMSAG